jgi:hypothetical protein
MRRIALRALLAKVMQPAGAAGHNRFWPEVSGAVWCEHNQGFSTADLASAGLKTQIRTYWPRFVISCMS